MKVKHLCAVMSAIALFGCGKETPSTTTSNVSSSSNTPSKEVFEIKGVSIGMPRDQIKTSLQSLPGTGACFNENLESDQILITSEQRLWCHINFYNTQAKIYVFFKDDKAVYISVPNLGQDEKVPHGAFLALAEKFGAKPQVDIKRTGSNKQDFTYTAAMIDRDKNVLKIQGKGGDYVDANNKTVPITTSANIQLESKDLPTIMENRRQELIQQQNAAEKKVEQAQKSNL